jgi:hypothetical protein
MKPQKLMRFRGHVSGGASGKWWHEPDGECPEVRGRVVSSTQTSPSTLHITVKGEDYTISFSDGSTPPRIECGRDNHPP